MTKINTHEKTLKMVILSFLTAIIIVLQVFASSFKIGVVPISLVLLPIVIGAMLLGKSSGAYLGAVFGLITFIMGAFAFDSFTMLLFTLKPVATFLICIVKSTLAGFLAGLLFQAIKSKFKNIYIPTLLASAVTPIVNTSIFALGMIVFFSDTLKEMAGDTNALTFLFITIIGINFVAEFVINVVICPIIVSPLLKNKKTRKLFWQNAQ